MFFPKNIIIVVKMVLILVKMTADQSLSTEFAKHDNQSTLLLKVRLSTSPSSWCWCWYSSRTNATYIPSSIDKQEILSWQVQNSYFLKSSLMFNFCSVLIHNKTFPSQNCKIGFLIQTKLLLLLNIVEVVWPQSFSEITQYAKL